MCLGPEPHHRTMDNHVDMHPVHDGRLWFDVSEVAADGTLLLAELRLYQNPDVADWYDDEEYVRDFVIDVYVVEAEDDEG